MSTSSQQHSRLCVWFVCSCQHFHVLQVLLWRALLCLDCVRGNIMCQPRPAPPTAANRLPAVHSPRLECWHWLAGAASGDGRRLSNSSAHMLGLIGSPLVRRLARHHVCEGVRGMRVKGLRYNLTGHMVISAVFDCQHSFLLCF